MTRLTSAPVPGVGSEDHARGEGAEAIGYLDLACPHCAVTWSRVTSLGLRLVFRHFPVASKHPRAPALHAAAEAAGIQGGEDAFWQLVDSVYEDRGRVDDPHLWQRARDLGLDLDRFESERRSDAVARRIRHDFEAGIRAGVTGTPAFFVGGDRADEDNLRSLAL
ncbi:MAG: DsbA family protein [Solirubrobacterales bacterium]